MTKAQARTQAKAERGALSNYEFEHLSAKIASAYFSEVNQSAIKSINTFLPLPEKKEPNIRILLEKLHDDFPHIQISIPYIQGNSKGLLPVAWSPNMEMVHGKHGTIHPRTIAPIAIESLDIVFVPLLAYDVRGYRAGYGGGYYDLFLAKCNASTQKIGISFFQPIEKIEDVWEGDVKLDSCLTPTGLLHF